MITKLNSNRMLFYSLKNKTEGGELILGIGQLGNSPTCLGHCLWLWAIPCYGFHVRQFHATDRPLGFIFPFMPTLGIATFVLFQSYCSHTHVFERTLVHELNIFYSHVE